MAPEEGSTLIIVVTVVVLAATVEVSVIGESTMAAGNLHVKHGPCL